MMATQTYTTKQGDTVSQIAARYGVPIASVTGYRSGDANRIGIGENLTINSPDLPPVNNINAADLNSKPFVAPPQSSPSGPTTLQGLAEATRLNIEASQKDVERGERDIKGIYDKLGKKNSERVGLYESEGVNTAQKELNEINNMIKAKDLAHRRRVEKIQNENPTGQLSEGQRIAIDKADREWASEGADLAIVAESKRGNYTTAKSIVDEKIKAETEDLQTRLSGLEFFYSQNYSRLTQDQRDLLKQQTDVVSQDLADKKELLSAIGDIQLEAAKNGAPASLITSIGKSGDVTSAISTAGKYIGLYDRLKADDDMADSGGGGSMDFTDTQVANGAANAGVPLSTFQGFDEDTKNFFINGDISGSKKTIDDAFSEEGASLEEVTAAINEMGLPAQGTQYLLQYAETSAGKNKPLSPEETTQTLISSMKSLQTSGYSRDEASEAIFNKLTENGKSSIPEALKKSIKDATVNVYGRTFFQKILPGGR